MLVKMHKVQFFMEFCMEMALTCVEWSEFSIWYTSCHGAHAISQLNKPLRIKNTDKSQYIPENGDIEVNETLPDTVPV